MFLVHFGRFEIGNDVALEYSGENVEIELNKSIVKVPKFVPEEYLINSINNLENSIDDEVTVDHSEFVELLKKCSWEIELIDEEVYATYIIANNWSLIQPTLDAIGASDYAIQRFLNNIQPYQCSFHRVTGMFNKPYYEVSLHVSSLPDRISWDIAKLFFNISDHFQ